MSTCSPPTEVFDDDFESLKVQVLLSGLFTHIQLSHLHQLASLILFYLRVQRLTVYKHIKNILKGHKNIIAS